MSRIEITCAEFFAGIGLVRMGLEKHGIRVIFANDNDPAKQEMYSAQFSDADEHFLLQDVHDLLPEQIPNADIATASFPCTDLSLAGSRKGLKGSQSSAFWGFISAVESMERRPAIILLENVLGFLSSNNGQDFTAAMKALNRLGYVVDPFIIDASWFVPQSRQRLFIVATLKDSFKGDKRITAARAKQYGFFESQLRPKQLANFVLEHPEIDWHCRQLPSPPEESPKLETIIDSSDDSIQNWWNEERSNYLINQMSPRHRAELDRMVSSSKISYGTVFRRVRKGRSMAELRNDGIAGCLRTPKGGSGRQILVKCGFGRFQVRLLNARECARLMGAADFNITVPQNQALFGFGDAVCVNAISWIAEHYILPSLSEQRTAA